MKKAGRGRAGRGDAGGDRAQPCSPAGVISKTARCSLRVKRFTIGVVLYLPPSSSTGFSANSSSPGPRTRALASVTGPICLALIVAGPSSTRPLLRMRLTLPEWVLVLTYSLPFTTTYQTGVTTSLPLFRNMVEVNVLVPLQRRKGVRGLFRHGLLRLFATARF